MTLKPGDLGCYDPEHVREKAGWWKRLLHGYFRCELHGFENLPDSPFLGVGNHSGGILIPDTLLWVAAYHASGRQPPLLALAHDGMFHYPSRISWWLARFGAIRADLDLALEGLRSGYAVQVYPGGDHDACRSFARRHELVFAGRRGYVSLAREAGVPVVPVVSVGAHETLFIVFEGRRLARFLGVDRRFRLKAFPLSICLPWLLWLGPLPGYLPLPAKIELSVLPPMMVEGSDEDFDARVQSLMQAEINRLVARRRLPVLG